MTTTTFTSVSPLDGRTVGTYPAHGVDEVAAAVGRARSAARGWRSLGFSGRRRVLQGWRRAIVADLDGLIDTVRAETGKPRGDARLEILLALDHLSWSAAHARRTLRRRRVASGALMFNQASSLGYVPYGVVGVIGPWNYPVFTPMGSIAYALAAGNAVVFKPSEYTPGVGAWLQRAFARAGGPADVFSVVTGFGETGAALCRAGVDKVAFTGSTATGKAVMAACAETLTPVVIEAGGKDALLVDEDADLDAAAEAAVWGAYSNAGQTCIGIERVYAHAAIYDRFVEAVAERTAEELRGGRRRGAARPPHHAATGRRGPLARRRRARAGRGPAGRTGARRGSTLQPVLLTDVDERSSAVRDETFGPTLVVNRVASMDEAVERANAVRYGLSGAVFSKRRGPRARAAPAWRDDRDQRGHRVRRCSRAPLRRGGGFGIRAYPRRRRTARVRLPQGAHPSALPAADAHDDATDALDRSPGRSPHPAPLPLSARGGGRHRTERTRMMTIEPSRPAMPLARKSPGNPPNSTTAPAPSSGPKA